MKKRALLSVSDKTGVVEFAKGLEKLGYEIISTGGTAKQLEENGIKVTGVSDITGFPECLDGRVKTLHPNVHAGILAIRDNKDHMDQLEKLNVTPIDVVAINLYPFKETILKDDVSLEQAIENIDIGGPTMIRAAAKNWQDVSVIVDPSDYTVVLDALNTSGDIKDINFTLARKVFSHTASYDAMISSYLDKQAGADKLPETVTYTFERVESLRYGENPHQNAAFYKEVGAPSNSIACAKQLHGKQLSFNNINDANGSLDIIKEFGMDKPCAVGVKHANPCGVGVGETIFQAYMEAYNADPVSIFGGIVALNREVDQETATELAKTFLEIIIAPSFTEKALEILTEKKNIRLLELPDLAKSNCAKNLDMKKVVGGMLVQELDTKVVPEEEFEVVTEEKPSEKEMEQLLFAWKVVKQVKSNAIVLVKGNATAGIGPGQTNRITALELAIKYSGKNCKGSVLASDAFFPFDDCVKLAAESGITAIIQPGGSVRDEDSIKACNEYGIAMVFTKTRHFKH